MEKGQSKLRSFLEANANTAVGLLIQLIAAPLVYKLVGMQWVFWQLGVSTLIFTIISVIRGYVIRRFFNKREEKKDSDLLSEIQSLKRQRVIDLQLGSGWEKVANHNRRQRFIQAVTISEMTEKLADYFKLQVEVDKFISALKSDDTYNGLMEINTSPLTQAYFTAIGGLINQIKLRDDTISEWIDKYGNLEDELDLCKHHHLASVSDQVEQADYHSGNENFPGLDSDK